MQHSNGNSNHGKGSDVQGSRHSAPTRNWFTTGKEEPHGGDRLQKTFVEKGGLGDG